MEDIKEEKTTTSTIKNGKGIESKVTTKRIEYENGAYDEVKVQEVEGGFIKTITKHWKNDEGDWQWKDDISVHTENPLEKKSLIDKLEAFAKEQGISD